MRDLLHFHTASAEENNRAADTDMTDFIAAMNELLRAPHPVSETQITITEEI